MAMEPYIKKWPYNIVHFYVVLKFSPLPLKSSEIQGGGVEDEDKDEINRIKKKEEI